MAKRKLSSSQRIELRKGMAQGLKAGRERSALVKEAAEKYGITTVTAAWYLKSLNGKARPAPKAKRRRKAKAAAVRPRNGVLLHAVRAVESKAAQVAKKARDVGRLVPKWRSLLKKEQSLKALVSKGRRQLSTISRSAKSLGARIKKLLGR